MSLGIQVDATVRDALRRLVLHLDGDFPRHLRERDIDVTLWRTDRRALAPDYTLVARSRWEDVVVLYQDWQPLLLIESPRDAFERAVEWQTFSLETARTSELGERVYVLGVTG